MQISARTSVELALNHTKAILFDDFGLRKWVGLSFCLYLNYFWLSWPDYGQSPDGSFPDYGEWIRQNPLATFFVITAMLLMALASAWVQSRAKFMFLDTVLTNRSAIRESWNQFRIPGKRFFPVQVVMIVLASAVSMLNLVYFMGNFMDAVQRGNFTFQDMAFTMGPFFAITLLFWGGFWFMYIILGDFLVPIMYRRDVGLRKAYSLYRTEIATHHGALIRFVGMKFLLSCAAMILLMVGACISSCITMLPIGLVSMMAPDSPWLIYAVSLPSNFIYALIFLPLFVFFRLYSIYFIEQFGPDWRFFEREDDPEKGAMELTSGLHEYEDPMIP